jgi:hypothetical protein
MLCCLVIALWAGHDLLSTNTVDKEDSVSVHHISMFLLLRLGEDTSLA